MILLIYLMVRILLKTFRIILNLSSKKPQNFDRKPTSSNLSKKKIKNRIVSKIKTNYKLELLTPEIMRLLGSTRKEVDKDKDRENLPKLESVEVVLMHCYLVKNDYQ